MNVNHTEIEEPNRLFTWHGTMLFVDTGSGELRHGPLAGSPSNVVLAREGEQARLTFVGTDGPQDIACLHEYSAALGSEKTRDKTSVCGGVFTCVPTAGKTFGLSQNGLFLCAERDGRITLSRFVCSGWERFHTAGTWESLCEMAPFLEQVDSPNLRRAKTKNFDEKLGRVLSASGASTLPIIHCFYEILSDSAQHNILLASISSMLAAGHSVKMWSYSPEKLHFLPKNGLELCDAGTVIPRQMFNQIVAHTDIRYFSDIFRYAVLYERGGLWIDGDVILLRPFPFRGDHFFNLQWRGARNWGHGVVGNVIYARQFSQHLYNLYKESLRRYWDGAQRGFGDVGPLLLTDYMVSPAGTELWSSIYSPMLFNSIDHTELNILDLPISAVAEYLNDDRVFGVHLWEKKTGNKNCPVGSQSLISSLTELSNSPRFNTLAPWPQSI